MPPVPPAALTAPSMQVLTPVTGPNGPQGPPGISGDSTETLEQRIYDLLAPLREMEQDHDGEDECKAVILCENIAFLIRHNYNRHGQRINPNDVSLATKNWAARNTGQGTVGIAIFVNAHGFSNTILRTLVKRDHDIIGKLLEEVDRHLQQFFPGI